MMKTYTTALMLALSMFLFSTNLYSSKCQDAPIISCGHTKDGNTNGGYSSFDKSHYGGYAGGIWYTGVDHMYKVHKSSAGPMDIHLSTNHHGINVFLANFCSGGTLKCIAGGKAMKGGMMIENKGANWPAGTYYVIVDSKDQYTHGTYSLTVTCGELDCSGAKEIKCGETLWDQSNHSSYNNASTYGCGYNKYTNYTGKERVYFFDLHYSDEVKISLSGIKQGLDFDLFLIKEDHHLGCASDGCISSSTYPLHNSEEIVRWLEKGRYYIVVETWAHEHGYFNIGVESYQCNYYSGGNPGGNHNNSACSKNTVLNCDTHHKNHSNSYQYSTNYMSKHDYNGKSYGGYDGYERVYEFYVEDAGEYEVELYNHGYNVNYDMFLYKDQCGYGNCYAMSNRYGSQHEYINKWMDPGYYYLVVDTWYGEEGRYDIKLTGCKTHPSQEMCQDAHKVSCGTYLRGESTRNHRNWNESYTYGGQTYSGYDGYEKVYNFKLTKEESMDIYLTDVSGYGVNYDMFLYRGGCHKNDCVGMSRGYGHSDEKMDVRLPAGDYYVVVDTWKGEHGSYSLSIDGCKTGGGQSFVDCGNARSLKCGDYYSGNTWGRKSHYNWNTYSCSSTGWNYDGGDEIFRINKDSYGGKMQIHLETKEKGLNIILAEKCGYDFRCLTEGTDYYGGKYIAQGSHNWGAGEYYVIVDGKFAHTKGDYKIYATCGSTDFGGAKEISCGANMVNQKTHDGYNRTSIYNCGGSYDMGYIGKEKVYSFNVHHPKQMKIELSSHNSIGSMGLMLYKKNGNNHDCWGSGKISGGKKYIEAPMTQGKYYVVVDSYKDVNYDLKITGCACQPDNVITCAYPLQGNNWNASNDFDGTSGDCFSAHIDLPAKDISYEFKAPESKTYVFRLSDMQMNLDLFVVENCKDGKTCMGYSTRNNKINDEVTVDLVKGQVVYAIVDGIFEHSKSKFTLTVDCDNTYEDSDNDGVSDSADNCPTIANANQADNDSDGIGDVCDADDDNDGLSDVVDCFPTDASKAFRIGDSCDDGNANTNDDTIGTDCTCGGTSGNDADNDGILDGADNCPTDSNANQLNTDNDDEGDACDIDDDNDGVMDSFDCNPTDATKSFKIGDICDDGLTTTTNDKIDANCQCVGQGDTDGDGISDSVDNCPGMPNADQADLDNNGIGDLCDDDRDGDGTANAEDCEPDNSNVATKAGDACDDNNPATNGDVIGANCVCAGTEMDTDGDGINDTQDNCPTIANADQIDFDGDGLGNSCDSDNDNDGVPNEMDCFPFDFNIVFSPGETCDDENPNTVSDRVNDDCVCIGETNSSLFVSSTQGAVGDTVCVSVGIEGPSSLGSAMFTIRVDSTLGKVVSVNNIAFTSGTFSSNVNLNGIIGTDNVKATLVSWRTDTSTRFTLTDSTTLVDVCIEILASDTFDVIIDDSVNIAGTEVVLNFNDADALPIPLDISNGSINVVDDSLVNNITGNISTVKGLALPTVEVFTTSNDKIRVRTDSRGNYNLGVGTQDSYVVQPFLDERSGEGISMIDVMMLNRHLNFVTSFNNPYQYVAADIDGNGELTIRDEQVLVRFLLNMITEGEMPKSWRFIPGNFTMPEIPEFSRTTSALNHPQSALVNMTDLERFQNFIGVKVGDFDFSASLSGFASTEIRSRGLEILKAEQKVRKGDIVKITFSAEDFENAEAIVLNFKVSPGDLVFDNVNTDLNEGELTVLNDTESTDNLALALFPQRNDYQVTISFRANTSGNLSDLLSLRNDAISRVITSDNEEQNINLKFESKVEDRAKMFISPNPITESAHIIYESANEEAIDLSIYTTEGKLLYNRKTVAQKGSNLFVIGRDELGKAATGVIFISIQNQESVLLERAVMMH